MSKSEKGVATGAGNYVGKIPEAARLRAEGRKSIEKAIFQLLDGLDLKRVPRSILHAAKVLREVVSAATAPVVQMLDAVLAHRPGDDNVVDMTKSRRFGLPAPTGPTG